MSYEDFKRVFSKGEADELETRNIGFEGEK